MGWFHAQATATGAVTLVQGFLQRTAESAWLDLAPTADEDALTATARQLVTYRIALGPQAGVRRWCAHDHALAGEDRVSERVAKAFGFSLHAGRERRGTQREVAERLLSLHCPPGVA